VRSPSMENEQDAKKKDKPIPEEELFDELDAMYQRVADIEKEEAAEILTPVEPGSSSTAGTRVPPEKPVKKKSGRNRNRLYRTILGGMTILLALILGVALWKPMSILNLLRIGDGREPTISPLPAPRKPSAVVTPKAPPAPPTVPATRAPSPPPTAVTPSAPPIPPTAASSAPPKLPSESVTAQAKQKAVKSPREEEKVKPAPSENLKPDKPAPQGKSYALQIGTFREMENVRNLVGILKKEGLDAFWTTSNSKKGTLYKVFVGRFRDTNEATQFLRDNKILENYPGSLVQEISSVKAGS
jgi:sporulation related protein